MSVLYLESSSKKIEFGYSDMNGNLLINELLPSESNADTLTYYIKKSFGKNKISFSEIKFISISNGPGSFTGLRISSAIAKGICLSIGCNLVELPTLDIIANKHKTVNEVTSLIFSNMRTMEFYCCTYRFEDRLVRISDYKTKLIENIIQPSSEYVINESLTDEIKRSVPVDIINVSGISNIDSMKELTEVYINENKFSDYKTSEPFYLKEFVPVKNS